jgi:hypothetical protein
VVFCPDAHQSSNIRPDDVIFRPDAQLSKPSSVRMMRTFHPGLPLCQEYSNCSSLHLSGHFSSMSRRHSVFDQLWDFFPKHRYEKTAATARTRSSIRQVVHSKFRRQNTSLHGPDAQATYMEIACIRSTIRTIIPIVRTREALIWKLRAVKVRPSRRQGTPS